MAEAEPTAGIGELRWSVAEGYIPSQGTGEGRAMESHETLCILNAGERPAEVSVTLYFGGREPAGPYPVTVAPRRTVHLRTNDLSDPEPVPRDTDYAAVVQSNVPIVVQHTRLDSRQAELGLLSTMAHPG